MILTVALPSNLIPQNRCPVVGDTITIIGQASVRTVHGLTLPELYPKQFPNQLQAICVKVQPYIGVGVGVVDRVLGSIAHIWLVSPKQLDVNGHIDWNHPEPIATGIFLEVTGKIIGQGDNILYSGMETAPYDITLEASTVKNVDTEMNKSIKSWRDECVKWVGSQLTSSVTAARVNPPPSGEQIKVQKYDIEPFASENGVPYPKCAATVAAYDAKGRYAGGDLIIARFPYVISNIGTVTLSHTVPR